MLIFIDGNVRVTQHQFLTLFNVEVFKDGDWTVHLQTSDINEVRQTVADLRNKRIN